MPQMTRSEAEELVVATLTRCATRIDNARSVARGIFRQLQHGAGAEFCITEKPWHAHGNVWETE